jgi:tRNA G10  N-methylase Trm11
MPISKDRDTTQVTAGPIIAPNLCAGDKHLYDTDLSFKGLDTQYSTHAIHTYPAAMNPPLARELISTYVPKSGTIFDPFCGGGCVLVESILSNRQCCGIEVNPLAVKIAKVKTSYIDKGLLSSEYLRVKHNIADYNFESNLLPDKNISYWFKPYMLQPLSAIKSAINNIGDEKIRVAFEIIFSAAIRDVMLTYRGEIRLRKLTGDDYERFNPDVLQTFDKRAELAIERISSLPKNARADVILMDAKHMTLNDESFTSIICSPPYGDDQNGVGYFQFSKNMLIWLGFQPSEIKRCRSMFLGLSKEATPLPPSKTLTRSLENVRLKDEMKLQEAIAFYSDYYRALSEMVRVTRETIVIVIGNRVLARTVFDNANITLELCKTLGVNLHHSYQRTLPKKRIANLGADGGGTNTEHVLVFRK